MKKLEAMGCGRLFPPGTDTSDIISYMTEEVKRLKKSELNLRSLKIPEPKNYNHVVFQYSL
jgi:hypothetical protein